MEEAAPPTDHKPARIHPHQPVHTWFCFVYAHVKESREDKEEKGKRGERDGEGKMEGEGRGGEDEREGKGRDRPCLL